MFSIVCVYNNRKILNRMLLKSLKNQTANYELILVDNTSRKFVSAAKALNYGEKKVHGNYIMFVHQDVELNSCSWLEDCEKMLVSIPDLGIAGVVGMSEKGKRNRDRGRNVIVHGNPPKPWSWGNPIRSPEPVQTVDECLIIIPHSVFDTLQFDENVCVHWHLYAVDYCLSIKRIGLEAYAIPMPIYHGSTGMWITKDYYLVLKKMLKKHKGYYNKIYTTFGEWNTSYPVVLQRIYRFIKWLLKID